ncbi:uncharacterized protein LOC101481474 isoform X1 [Maylandia zebra]|uniref:uncharacterized protein LOC101481474 isoform X1 n=1 Tax=Maylandia zebra TaxID=106582 RepID=UPI000329FC9D|nr:uncharacterized protein LOC101481474 isoform X1 [Maylandia zebra]XP_014269917.1 uncharacterized protein LOC101481474 isoform X1 [Maylandia zebra]
MERKRFVEEEDQEDCRLRKRWKAEYDEPSDDEDKKEEEDHKTWKTEGKQFLPVICGTTEGILDCEKLEQSKACIKYEGKWYKPPRFEILAEKGLCKKWKATIFYDDQPLEYWIKKGYLKTEGYRKGRSKTRKEIQSSGSEETEDDNAEERTTKHTISTAAKHPFRGKELRIILKRCFDGRQGTGACHSKWMTRPGECSSSAKVNTPTAAATLIAPSHIHDLSINGSDGEASEDQLPQSSERKEQEASTSLEIVNKTESRVLNSDARMDDREDGHLVHCGDDKEQNREDPLDMSRSEVSGNTRDVAIQTVPKVLLKAKIQPAEEAGGDIVEDKDQFLSSGQLAVKTEQRAEEKVGSGHENEVVNSEDAGNEEEEDEMETGGMESEAVPAVASNHTDKCVIKESSAERGDAQSANCGNEKEGDDPPNMPKSEVTVKTRDVERNTPIKQQNVEEKTEEEMSLSCEPRAASDECEHKDVHCSGHNVAALQSTRPERNSSPASQTSVGINFSHMSETLSPGPSVSSGLNTTDLDQLKREKLKMQLKVLKLQEECYTLIIKELKK